jgi:uncharacterized protein (TIGR02466 family)
MIKLIPFFNPIYVTELDKSEENLEDSIIHIKESGIYDYPRGNRGGWSSKSFSSNEKLFMNSLLNRIGIEVGTVYEDLGITSIPKLGNYWFNVNFKHDYNVTHNHPGSYISAVYYVRAPENCGEIVFERPDPFLDWIHDFEPNDNNVVMAKQQPKDNLLVIFPSYIRHYVEMNNSSGPRISIALNYR